MRIDDFLKPGYDRNVSPKKRTDVADTTAASNDRTAPPLANQSQSKADRIASLKQQFASGKPIDVNKLASTLAESGVFFDEQA